jgi:L-aminoadipate-semialdehyde dehydrogenase
MATVVGSNTNSITITAVFEAHTTDTKLGSQFTEDIYSLDPHALQDFLSERVPSYMIPRRWIPVSALPRLLNGKVDRKRVDRWLTDHYPVTSPVSVNGYHTENGSHKTSNYFEGATDLLSVLGSLSCNGVPFLKVDHTIPLSGLGLDSIQYMAISRKLQMTFDILIDLPTLGEMNLMELARYVKEHERGEATAKTDRDVLLLEEYGRLRRQLRENLLQPQRRTCRIFLTGATGQLGIQILRQTFLTFPDAVVLSLVRAKSSEEGWHRLSESANNESWCIDSYRDRIQVWTGDLALEQLGLNPSQWDCITGNAPRHLLIDAVIHSGAVVHWTKDYKSLQKQNVISTISLLRAVCQSPITPSFVYVSGGRSWKENYNSEMDLLEGAVSLCGYDLTKLLSDLLVMDFARVTENPRISIVRPGYIISTSKDGVANADDFL